MKAWQVTQTKILSVPSKSMEVENMLWGKYTILSANPIRANLLGMVEGWHSRTRD
jgi:hypothetical protein